MTMRWYVVHAYSGFEQQVRRSLEERVNRMGMQDLFGDILDVKLKGMDHISYHLISQYADWRGLEETMMDMYLEPQMMHDALAFLEAGHHKIREQWINLNLLSLNNDSTYNNSGGNLRLHKT